MGREVLTSALLFWTSYIDPKGLFSVRHQFSGQNQGLLQILSFPCMREETYLILNQNRSSKKLFCNVVLCFVSESYLTLQPCGLYPPGFSDCGISQARILEQVAISFSGDVVDSGMEPSSPVLQADSLPSELSGKPSKNIINLTVDCQAAGGSVMGTLMIYLYISFLFNTFLQDTQGEWICNLFPLVVREGY